MRRRLKSLAIFAGGSLAAFLLGIFLLNALIGLLIGHGTEVEVPDLSGLLVDEARSRLSRKELLLEVSSERASNLFTEGRIISQFPKPLATVKPGRKVEVIVSTGIEMATVPQLAGLSQLEAKQRIAEAGLSLGEPVAVHSQEAAANVVLASSPAGGASVARESPVVLLVSRGPEAGAFVMPDLVGLDYDDVARSLRLAGFALGAVATQEGSGREPGTVLQQSPDAGSRVVAESAIDLVIAAGR